MENFVKKRVGTCFQVNDYNCVRTDLLTLAEYFHVKLHGQLLAAAVGMPGAGGYRAQCGLVEGTLLFPGILEAERGVAEEKIIDACYDFGKQFEKEFSSLQCRELRPGGFDDDGPPHLCEGLACRTTAFSIRFIEKVLEVWAKEE